MRKPRKIEKLLAANPCEIAVRIFRAANELGLRTVGIYSQEDRLSLHRFKADETYPKITVEIIGFLVCAKVARLFARDHNHPW